MEECGSPPIRSSGRTGWVKQTARTAHGIQLWTFPQPLRLETVGLVGQLLPWDWACFPIWDMTKLVIWSPEEPWRIRVWAEDHTQKGFCPSNSHWLAQNFSLRWSCAWAEGVFPTHPRGLSKCIRQVRVVFSRSCSRSLKQGTIVFASLSPQRTPK